MVLARRSSVLFDWTASTKRNKRNKNDEWDQWGGMPTLRTNVTSSVGTEQERTQWSSIDLALDYRLNGNDNQGDTHLVKQQNVLLQKQTTMLNETLTRLEDSLRTLARKVATVVRPIRSCSTRNREKNAFWELRRIPQPD